MGDSPTSTPATKAPNPVLTPIAWVIIAIAHMRLRRQREARGEPPPALTMWLFPWASYAAIAGMAAVLIAMALTPGDLRQELWWSVVALGLALAAYLAVDARRRSRARLPGLQPRTDGT